MQDWQYRQLFIFMLGSLNVVVYKMYGVGRRSFHVEALRLEIDCQYAQIAQNRLAGRPCLPRHATTPECMP